MKFDPALLPARLIKRYKRFFADVEMIGPNGPEIVTAHCPNTGSMKHCLVPGSECWISRSDNPKRKLAYSLEAVSAEYGGMAGVNTLRANKLVKEAIEEGGIEELLGYESLEAEVKFGQQNSRLDFRLSSEGKQCLVEVKNVSLGLEGGLGAFPDAVTERGRKHLQELMVAREQGYRAALFFCVQHTNIEKVQPAWEMDLKYCEVLAKAIDCGVEVLVYGVRMSRQEFSLGQRLDFQLNHP